MGRRRQQPSRRPKNRPNREPDISRKVVDLGHRLWKLVVAAGVLAGVVAAVVVILEACEPSREQIATIRRLGVDHDVTFRAYLRGQGLATDAYPPDALAVLGAVVSPSIELVGFRGRGLPLRLAVVRTDGGITVWQDRETRLVGEAERENLTVFLFVPYPKRAGRYFIRVDILERPEARFPLDSHRTPPFSVS